MTRKDPPRLRKSLTDHLPDSDERWSHESMRLLTSLYAIAQRIDDVFEPRLADLENNLDENVEMQSEMMTMLNEFLAERQEEEPILASVRAHLQEDPPLRWADRIEGWVRGHPRSALIYVFLFFTFLPWVTMILSSLTIMLFKKFFGVDLPGLAPWLFQAGSTIVPPDSTNFMP